MRIKLLNYYRQQAINNLEFIGDWSGYYKTVIDEVVYHSQEISGFNYVLDETGNFIQNCIIDRVKQRRFNTKLNSLVNF